VPEDVDPGAIACVVDTPCGERSFGVYIDLNEDGSAVAFAVIDRVRNETLNCVGVSPDECCAAGIRACAKD
jgi:hypothetical protein